LKSRGSNVNISSRKSERKTTLTVGVVLVVGGLEDVEGGDEEVEGGVELELEDEDPPPLQGWVDSKSEAT
jgi:hypothetical protein